MIKPQILRKFSALFFVIWTASAQAIIIDNKSFTTDTKSGLDWLDVTLSVGRTHYDVSAHFGVGGDYEGWRYASGEEFNTLLTNFLGHSVIGYNRIIHSPGSMDGLVRLLGATSFIVDTYWVAHPELCDKVYCLNRLNVTNGILSDMYLDARRTAEIFDWSAREKHNNDYSETFANVIRREKYDYIGSFLVRYTEIPEPSTFALFGLGLLCCGTRSKHAQPRTPPAVR